MILKRTPNRSRQVILFCINMYMYCIRTPYQILDGYNSAIHLLGSNLGTRTTSMDGQDNTYHDSMVYIILVQEMGGGSGILDGTWMDGTMRDNICVPTIYTSSVQKKVCMKNAFFAV